MVSANAAGEASKVIPGLMDWSKLQVGDITQCTVSEHAQYGIVMDLDVHEVRKPG